MRYAIGVQYQGTHYFGTQSQDGLPTIQYALEQALSAVANTPISVSAAGRTDKGVHAVEMVFHFDTDAIRPEHGWLMGANVHLNPDIRIMWVAPVADDFDARASAVARTYHYYISCGHKGAHARELVTANFHELDVSAMHISAQALVGEHDFSAFRASACQAHHPRRYLSAISVCRIGDLIKISVTANAFLHHMVRNIVGTLLRVGEGVEDLEFVGRVLSSRDRKLAGRTAPATGLYMVHVHYPSQFKLPQLRKAPFFDHQALSSDEELGIMGLNKHIEAIS